MSEVCIICEEHFNEAKKKGYVRDVIDEGFYPGYICDVKGCEKDLTTLAEIDERFWESGE